MPKKLMIVALFLFVGFALFITIRDGQTFGNDQLHPPSWHRIVFWPEGVTAWAILATLWFIAVQAEETAKSANAAKDAARAARIQAEHIAASERAWLVIRSAMDGWKPSVGDKFDYWWTIENTGNTPARITETQCCYELVDNRTSRALPPTPKYPPPIHLSGFLLPPKAVAAYSAHLLSPAGRIIKCGDLDESAIDRIRLGLSELRVYGYVKYLDVFANERESRFVEYYVWPEKDRPARAVGFRPLIDAPAEYTKCT